MRERQLGWESAEFEARTAKERDFNLAGFRFIPRETKEQNAFDFASRVARLKRKEEYSRERDFNRSKGYFVIPRSLLRSR